MRSRKVSRAFLCKNPAADGRSDLASKLQHDVEAIALVYRSHGRNRRARVQAAVECRRDSAGSANGRVTLRHLKAGGRDPPTNRNVGTKEITPKGRDLPTVSAENGALFHGYSDKSVDAPVIHKKKVAARRESQLGRGDI